MATTATSLPRSSTVRPIHRPDTSARWQAAAKRAIAEGVTVRQLAGSGGWIATSSSDSGTAYEVTPWQCECRAGEFDDPCCKHRAALRVRLGWLAVDPDPEPPPTPVAIRQPERPCPDCRGDGWWYGSGRDCAHTTITCGNCLGTGVDPDTLVVA